MNDFLIDLIAGILHQAIEQTEEWQDCWYNAMHWTIHRIESRFTHL